MTQYKDIGQAATDLMITYEIGDQYDPRITWPGGASGPTWGVGYDGGYHTASEIRVDWTGLVDAQTLLVLVGCAGYTGTQAQAKVRDIHNSEVGAHFGTVSYDAAMSVYHNTEVPRYSQFTLSTFQNCDMLPTDSFGALVSLVQNRGSSMQDYSGPVDKPRLEMRQIRDAMASKNFAVIPDYIRNMKRIWKGAGLGGLIIRREAEAVLFEKGLSTLDKQYDSEDEKES